VTEWREGSIDKLPPGVMVVDFTHRGACNRLRLEPLVWPFPVKCYGVESQRRSATRS